MNRLLIIDGHNLLFQMFYGMPTRIINKNGKQIQGIVGFIGALFKMIHTLNPTHLLLIFDGENLNPRTLISSDYKANRIDYSLVQESDSPFSQLPSIYQVLKHLAIPFIETTDVEADDVIASYVHHYKKEIEIIISSFDSDFFSLIDSNVTLYRYRGKSSYPINKDFILKKLNIEPYQYSLFKSLVGDPADNIKGVYGIGPKTVSYLVRGISTVEELFEKTNYIENEKLKRKILEHKDILKKNYALIQFQILKDLPLSLESLIYKLKDTMTSTIALKETNIW